MNDLIYVCAPAPLQYGVATGMARLGDHFYQNLNREYTHKRHKLCHALEQAGLHPHIPQGAYYVLANVSSLPGDTSKKKAMFLLGQTGVACVPGEAFFHDNSGNDLVRFCFAKSDDELEEACTRLSRISETASVSR